MTGVAGNPPRGLINLVSVCKWTRRGIGGPERMWCSRLRVRQELWVSAAALDQLSFNISFVGGPLLAGIVIGTSGVGWAFLLDMASVVVAPVLIVSAGTLPRIAVQGRPLAATGDALVSSPHRGRPLAAVRGGQMGSGVDGCQRSSR